MLKWEEKEDYYIDCSDEVYANNKYGDGRWHFSFCRAVIDANDLLLVED